ncbi:hybrid sensor histidine kinase/response regulator [Ramlibacter rhizophilus]|uniref:histidine kinase n=1 Tax=Ramlibacter rhizophilus TaxID=1781167 RepID=A0A4Z0C096_9BURK|nr:response regulator [Ramlibacter rhizophilus]TFZ04352.1 response regulator [Ramlibacter rhizophilus]
MPHTLKSPARGMLRFLPLACVLLPVLALILVGAWRYVQLWNEAEDRLDRTVRVAAEHARGVLDTTQALLDRVRDAAGSAHGAEGLAAQQSALHAALAAMARDKPQLQGIFIFGPDARPKAASRFYPAPDVWVGDRDYFLWHQQGGRGVYISQPLVARTTGEPFMDVSVGRSDAGGRFDGVISISLLAPYFEAFYADLTREEQGMALMLFRADGGVFARTPRSLHVERLPADSLVMPELAQGRTEGRAHGISGVDGRERLAHFRQVGHFPLYVSAAMESAAVRARWLQEMAILALFGLPAAFGLAFAVRTVITRGNASVEAARRLAESLRLQQEMQSTLLQAQKLEALGRITGGVAHDFNNALMVMSNSLALLRIKHPGVSSTYLAPMDRALNAATQLTRQLLAFSRRQALVPEQVLLQRHLPTTADLLRPVLGSRVDLRIEVAPDTAPIRVDTAEFELALINLAINARDAMPGGGRFVLRAANAAAPVPGLAGELVMVEAEDSGAGMPPEIVDKVFEPFFTTKPAGQGTGLGLSQVYGMCQRAGGCATVESRPGEGTTIRMFFAVDATPPAAEPARASAEPACAARRRVLVVEDNAAVASALLPLLEAAGCEVRHVDRGDAALALLESATELPDVLLTDVVMPGDIDGLALARSVRQRWPQLRIVVMTGYSEQVEQIAADGFPVLPKPCSLDALSRALNEPQAFGVNSRP